METDQLMPKMSPDPYEVEKLFQDGGKKNNFTRSDITGIHVEFESRTNFTFGDNLPALFNE